MQLSSSQPRGPAAGSQADCGCSVPPSGLPGGPGHRPRWCELSCALSSLHTRPVHMNHLNKMEARRKQLARLGWFIQPAVVVRRKPCAIRTVRKFEQPLICKSFWSLCHLFLYVQKGSAQDHYVSNENGRGDTEFMTPLYISCSHNNAFLFCQKI